MDVFDVTLLGWIQDHLPPQRKDAEIVKKFSRQLLLAVQYLHHQKGLCHMDVKPTNIFMVHSSHLKLGDFGLMRPKNDKTLPLTMGCPGYRPPEGLNEKVAITMDLEKVDIWSVGLPVDNWEGGVRQKFPAFDLPIQATRGQLEKNLVTMKAETPLQPGSQEELVLKMLQWAPGDRPTATELLIHPWLCRMPSDESLSRESGLCVPSDCERPEAPPNKQKCAAMKRKRSTERTAKAPSPRQQAEQHQAKRSKG